MSEIKKITLENDILYLKKGIFGWNIVEPIKNEDGTFNWFNFITGGWRSLIAMAFILLLLGLFYLAWNEAISQATECFARNQTVISVVTNYNAEINLSNLNLIS